MGSQVSGKLWPDAPLRQNPYQPGLGYWKHLFSLFNTASPNINEETCDKCDTYARCWSCSSASISGFEGRVLKEVVCCFNASASLWEALQMMFFTFKSPYSAASGPENSVPASGWAATHRPLFYGQSGCNHTCLVDPRSMMVWFVLTLSSNSTNEFVMALTGMASTMTSAHDKASSR